MRSGGGIAGLALAVTLSKYGDDVAIDVFEAATEVGTIGVGLAVFKRTWDIWRKLGLDERVRERNLPFPKEEECKSTHAVVCAV